MSKVEVKDEKPHYNVTAGLIWKGGKVLIARRPKGVHLEDLWEFPGGKRERGEGLEDCLEREINEELRLEVRADEPLLTLDHEYPGKRITLHFFKCTLIRGEPEAIACQEFRWVWPGDLSSFVFPPPDVKAIDILMHRGMGKDEGDEGFDVKSPKGLDTPYATS